MGSSSRNSNAIESRKRLEGDSGTQIVRPLKKARPTWTGTSHRVAANQCPYHYFTSDMLHHIFGFFFSDGDDDTGNIRDIVVDGNTLRSAMLVSKQWNKVATSPSLWKKHQDHGASKTTDPVDHIERALSITDFDHVLGCKSEKLSLVGFTKMDSLIDDGFGDNSKVYRALERSRGIQCILAVSPNNSRSMVLLNHIYERDFFKGGSIFLARKERETFERWQNHYPLGVILVGHHVIRWYQDVDDKQVLPPPFFATSSLEPDHLDYSSALSHLIRDHRHLRCLERRSNFSEIANHLTRRSWAMIVDWLVEITQCFNIPRRVPFHAMDLFRRFISHAKGRVKPKLCQLVASACMSIACKCNMVSSITATDFARCSDNCFTAEQLDSIEDMVIVALDWKLASPVITDFTQAFMAHSDSDTGGYDFRERLMVDYLSELALQSQLHADFEPSLIATCVAVFARYCLQRDDKPLWKPSYDLLSGYTFARICSGIVTLSLRLEEIRSFVPDVNVIDRSYRVVSSKIAIPTITSPAVLIAYQERMTRGNNLR